MDALTALLVIGALVAVATLLGLGLRARATRVATGCGGDEHQLAVDGAEVTLVQLSSPVCSACAAMRRVGSALAAADPTIAHREIDVVDEPEVARRHSVFSTPTTLVLDRDGHVRARLIGAVKPADVRAAVEAARTLAAVTA
ncbi:thioredoxin family protein [Microcella sp.]|uniref:thioredoxin family protein n=1 Tax=Microcella sp. TaxID=1913979 RepID=UPI003F6F551B